MGETEEKTIFWKNAIDLLKRFRGTNYSVLYFNCVVGRTEEKPHFFKIWVIDWNLFVWIVNLAMRVNWGVYRAKAHARFNPQFFKMWVINLNVLCGVTNFVMQINRLVGKTEAKPTIFQILRDYYKTEFFS
jgi:hypothetical protein